MTNKKPFVPVVAVLNMKGGVGKTTVCASVFRTMFESKRKSVLMIDLDPQYNLTQSLFNRKKYDGFKTSGRTVLSILEDPTNVGLYSVNNASVPIPTTADVSEVMWHFTGLSPATQLAVVPGDFGLVKYTLMDDHKQLKKAKKRFLKFVDDAKSEFDLVVIDCNPSSSFITSCALNACTHILVPIVSDRYSILGLEILSEFVENMPVHPKPKLIPVLNRVPRSNVDAESKIIESELRGHQKFGSATLVNVVHESGLLKARPNFTGFAVDRGGPWSGVMRSEMRALVNELSKKIGVK